MPERKIIHIDMDAFYASIEQRDHPEFRGKPLAVGYPGLRGVVAAASYEARRYGVRSALSSQVALRKCPNLIFAPPRFEVYKEVSNQIRDIFLDYTDLVEPLSLDEAFLDVTVNHKNIPIATEIAKQIKQRIKEQTGLTASAGVSVNKFLAKIASDYRKPDGLFVIKPSQAEEFVAGLEIERFFGIGKVTAEKMHQMGIHTGADLKLVDQQTLIAAFGKVGYSYYQYARGIDDREVEPNRIRKSVGSENTFHEDLGTIEELERELIAIREDVWQYVSRKSLYGKTVTIKVKYEDFKQITRSKTNAEKITDLNTLIQISNELLQSIDLSEKKVRLLGLTISNMENSELEKQISRMPLQLRLEFKDDWIE